jgi:hypothetical protein
MSLLDVFPNDLIGVLGTSYTQSNTVLPGPTNPAIYPWFYDARQTLNAKYAVDSLDGSGTKVKGITSYRRAPRWIRGGVIGQNFAGFNAAGYFFSKVGQYNPNCVIVEAGENDIGSGTFLADATTLAGIVKNPANYAAGIVTARWIAWVSCMWRGTEAWSPAPDANIVAANNNIKTVCTAQGFTYIDAFSLWLAEAPSTNPGNATNGFYNWDGTHPTGPNGPHGDLGCDVMGRATIATMKLHF